MTTVRSMRSALILCALAACSAEPSSQVISGRFQTNQGALAIRAVSGAEIVSAAQVRSDGSFTLRVPTGEDYRLEVLTRRGVKHIVAPSQASGGFRELVFSVCQPVSPYDVGSIGAPSYDCDPQDPDCKPPCDPTTGMCPPPPCTDPMDPNCQPPPPCDPMTDPYCDCQADGSCPPPCPADDPGCNCDPMTGQCPPPPPPCMDPTDPNCGCEADGSCPPPPSCDPMTDPDCKCDAAGNCPPLPCTDPMDPNCQPCTDPYDPTCNPPPPCTDPNDPNCKPPCMDPNDPTCGCAADGSCPPPPCENPMDPDTCTDPCANDPMSCGCTMEDPNCWPPPDTCCDSSGMCEPDDGMMPANVPSDFGCKAN